LGQTVTTNYRALSEVEAIGKHHFLETVRRTSGDQAAHAVTADMQQKNYLRLWAQHNVADGLRLGEVADLFTSYWVETGRWRTR
jgi:hypothetical protein